MDGICFCCEDVITSSHFFFFRWMEEIQTHIDALVESKPSLRARRERITFSRGAPRSVCFLFQEYICILDLYHSYHSSFYYSCDSYLFFIFCSYLLQRKRFLQPMSPTKFLWMTLLELPKKQRVRT